jgi:MazG family protein
MIRAVTHTEKLLDIMARLRDPNGGCPWDVEQTFATIAPYTIEEAYEVDDAIRRGAWDDLRDELGDLLLQVVFHAQMAREAEHFDFDDVAASICDKLVRRHPHVFGDAEVHSAEDQLAAWDAQKEQERAARAEREGRPPSALDDVPQALPALLRAAKLQRRAARAGFDWERDDPHFAALQQLAGDLDTTSVGALLFACARVASAAGIDPEEAARDASARFESRFRARESELG